MVGAEDLLEILVRTGLLAVIFLAHFINNPYKSYLNGPAFPHPRAPARPRPRRHPVPRPLQAGWNFLSAPQPPVHRLIRILCQGEKQDRKEPGVFAAMLHILRFRLQDL